jgi:hypothetical protein
MLKHNDKTLTYLSTLPPHTHTSPSTHPHTHIHTHTHTHAHTHTHIHIHTHTHAHTHTQESEVAAVRIIEAENTVQGSDAIIGKLESDLLALKVGIVKVITEVAFLGK